MPIIGTSISLKTKEGLEAICQRKGTSLYKEIQTVVTKYVEENERANAFKTTDMYKQENEN